MTVEGSRGSGTGRTGMCRKPVPRKVGNDQVGTRPRNVQDGTSNGVATTFLLRGSPRKERVWPEVGPRAPGDANFFGRRWKRCRRVWKSAEGTRKITREAGKMRKTLRSIGKPSGSARQSKEWKGALRKSAGRKARGADEAGQVGIRSDEKGKFVVPTN